MNKSILLMYNCKFHYILLDICLLESSIKMYDSKNRPLTIIDPLIELLNYIFEMYCNKKKNKGLHRPYCKKFQVSTYKWIKRQPMGNNHCGFYVMHYIHCYTGDDFSALSEQEHEVGTSEMVAIEIIALLEQFAGFILDQIMHEDREYNILKV
ncbi:unnamed protein product [Urochloa humidicola]